MIYGLGMLEMGITMNLAQLVIDNDFAAMIRRVLKGIPVNDEQLAADVIKRVGARGNFIAEDHTLKFMREYNSQPVYIDREARDAWEAKGSKTLLEKAEDRARELLETYKPEPLDPEKMQRITALRMAGEEELGLRPKEREV